jgi:hypothetical protein
MFMLKIGAASKVINGEIGSWIMGGGYSGVPLSWSRLSEQAGYLMVDAASGLLRKIWR